MEESPKKEIAIPKSMFCKHDFYLFKGFIVKEGMDIWFFCSNCLLTIKKKVTDESANL